MNKVLPLLLLCISAGLMMCQPERMPDHERAAQTFLSSLDESQLSRATHPLQHESRELWHFLPHTMFARPGIPLADLSAEQETLLMELLRSSLSKAGYDKARTIIGLEDVLAEIEGDPEYRDPKKYYAAFYGEPGSDRIWSWAFEGHHLSLNFTVAPDHVAMVPRFMGANPARIPSGERRGERTLSAEEDLGLNLVASLDSTQLEQAMVREETFNDIVTGNQSRAEPLAPPGIAVADLDSNQQEMLQRLIDEYLGAMPKELADKRRAKIRFDAIHFGWAGALELGAPHYYRVQGPSFLIEFDNTQNNANHIHAVWRDFEGDFGRDLIGEHYQNTPH